MIELPGVREDGMSGRNVQRNGRDFAAWLGLVPKQMSTGDRTILGHISKRGNRYCAIYAHCSCRAPG